MGFLQQSDPMLLLEILLCERVPVLKGFTPHEIVFIRKDSTVYDLSEVTGRSLTNRMILHYIFHCIRQCCSVRTYVVYVRMFKMVVFAL